MMSGSIKSGPPESVEFGCLLSDMPDLDVRKMPLIFLRLNSRKLYLQRQSGAKGTGFISEKQ